MNVKEERIFNFSAGPAVQPLPVLEKIKSNLLNYKGSGIGVMELSHRSKEFAQIIESTEHKLRSLLDIDQSFDVLFLTGGATNQFSMVPMNLLPKGATASYCLTGVWAKKALEEAQKFGETNVASSSEVNAYRSLPQEHNFPKQAAYFHYTSNNTIYGTQFHEEPIIDGPPLVCDASSDFLHKKIDISRYGLIYAGAQKNLGPAGVTIVIINKKLLERVPAGLPIMMDYRTYSKSKSLYNTPPTFSIYGVLEVLTWLQDLGGLDAMEKMNREKANLLYDAIDKTDFYQGVAQVEDRSLMNVTFVLQNKELENKFLEEAELRGFSGLRGHRSIGGIRASIYNAFPRDGVEALTKFMDEFESKHG
jgi:phosphoserine aminotransferase